MVRATLGHVHLKVRDLERAIGFYSRVLGLRVTERVDAHFAFLSGGDAHHEVALQELGPEAAGPDPHGVGLYHVAFEVPDAASLATAYDMLVEAGIPVAAVDHAISWALYFVDPDGNGVEIYLDRRRSPGGDALWHGRSRRLTREALRDAAGLAGQGVTGPPA